MTNQQRYHPVRSILVLAWPAVLEMCLHTVIWIADAAMVMRLGAVSYTHLLQESPGNDRFMLRGNLLLVLRLGVAGRREGPGPLVFNSVKKEQQGSEDALRF